MSNLAYSFDKGSKQHQVEYTTPKGEKVVCAVSEYKMKDRSLHEVIESTFKCIIKTINEGEKPNG